MNRWTAKDAIMEEEQMTLDKFEINLNVDMNVASNEKDKEKDIMNFQMKKNALIYLFIKCTCCLSHGLRQLQVAHNILRQGLNTI